MNAIINTKLVMEDGIIWDGAITYDNETIIQVGWAKDVTVPSDANIIDAGGLYTAPGLIDIHNHGCTESSFQDDPTGCCEYFLKNGITTVLPTFYHSMTMQEMLAGAERIRSASQTGAGRIMAGLYMEGPFMALQGSMQNSLKWSGDIKSSEYIPLIEGLGDMVRIWAIDPDRKNIEEFMQYAREKTPQAIFAHGHSRSTAEAIHALRHYGVKIRTHITDGGLAPGRAQGTPGAGGDEYCLYEPDMYAELICDETGIHVPPYLIKLIVKTKGIDRVCLISDHDTKQGDYRNNEAMGVWFGPDLSYDDEGYLSGSLMTLNNAVRNLMTHTGYGLCHAIRMATLTPARLLGIDCRVGSLAAGKIANLILIDDMVDVKQVILEGKKVIENEELRSV